MDLNRSKTPTPDRRRPLLAALALGLMLAPAALAQSSATLGSEDLTPPLDRYQPGDRVRYTATVNPEAYDDLVRYVATPPAELRLRPGTVTTTQGTIVRGNAPGDTDVLVYLGVVPGSSMAVIRYELEIRAPLSEEIGAALHQGAVVGGGLPFSLLTDSDPSQPGAQPDRLTIVHEYDVAARLLDTDASGDGFAVPGEVIRYTTEVELSGGTLSLLGQRGRLRVASFAHAGLIAGSVTTSVGAVVRGNGAGDTTIEVSLEGMPVFTTATIGFDARTVAPIPPGVTEVVVQGEVGTRLDGVVSTDDPAAPGAADPTRTPIGRVDLVLGKDDGGITTDAGQVLSYQLSVENRGTVAAAGAVLSETVPQHTDFDPSASAAGWVCTGGGTPGASCTLALGSVAAGASATRVFAVRVRAPLPAGVEQIANTASVTDDGSGGPDTNPTDNTAGDTTPLGAGTAPDLTLEKDDGGAIAEPGGVVVYTLGVGNIGSQGATGVAITETVPAHTSFEPAASTPGWVCAGAGQAGDACLFVIGNLPGSDGTINVDFAVRVVEPIPPGVTVILNRAAVADDGANGPDLNPADNRASDTTPITAVIDLEVEKDDGGVGALPGEPLVYQLSARNRGNRTATGVVLSEVIPRGTRFDAATSSPGWTCASGGGAGDVCTLALGTLGTVAAVRELGVVVDAELPPSLSCLYNVVTLADDGAGGADPDLTNNRDTLLTPVGNATCVAGPGPDLALAITDHALTASPGDTVLYSLDASNNGNRNALGVMLTTTIPAYTRLEPAMSSLDWECTGDGGAGELCRLDLNGLPPGSSLGALLALAFDPEIPHEITSVTLTVFLADDGTNGPDQNPADNQASEQTPVTFPGSGPGPDLSLLKDDGGITTGPGQVVVYVLTYENEGTTEATGVVLHETVPAHTSFDPAASTPGWVCAAGGGPDDTCALAVGTLAAQAEGSAAFAVLVDEQIPAGARRIDNVARIDDDGSHGDDLDPADNEAFATTPLAGGRVPDVPTLGALGLLLLGGGLGVLGVRRLRLAR